MNRRSLIKGILGLPALLGFRRKAAAPGFDAVARLKVGRPAGYLTGANYLTAEQVADVHAMLPDLGNPDLLTPGLVPSIPVPLSEVSAAEAVMAEDPDLGALLQELEGQTYPVLGEDGELIWERPEAAEALGGDDLSTKLLNLQDGGTMDLVWDPSLDVPSDQVLGNDALIAAFEGQMMQGLGVPASRVFHQDDKLPSSTEELLHALDKGAADLGLKAYAETLDLEGPDTGPNPYPAVVPLPEAYNPPPARDDLDILPVDTRTSVIFFQPGPVAVEALQDDVTGEDLVAARHDVAVHGVLF